MTFRNNPTIYVLVHLTFNLEIYYFEFSTRLEIFFKISVLITEKYNIFLVDIHARSLFASSRASVGHLKATTRMMGAPVM